MDLLRSRAIPALIATLAVTAARAACEALDGTYRYETASTAPGRPRYPSDFATRMASHEHRSARWQAARKEIRFAAVK